MRALNLSYAHEAAVRPVMEDIRLDTTMGVVEDIRLDTTMGTFTIELYPQHAPKACQNFTSLARKGYYDGIVFHRIIKDFMVQGGDPTGTGRGGESTFGGKFEVRALPLTLPTLARRSQAFAPLGSTLLASMITPSCTTLMPLRKTIHHRPDMRRWNRSEPPGPPLRAAVHPPLNAALTDAKAYSDALPSSARRKNGSGNLRPANQLW